MTIPSINSVEIILHAMGENRKRCLGAFLFVKISPTKCHLYVEEVFAGNSLLLLNSWGGGD
jgi:hypothetical protein